MFDSTLVSRANTYTSGGAGDTISSLVFDQTHDCVYTGDLKTIDRYNDYKHKLTNIKHCCDTHFLLSLQLFLTVYIKDLGSYVHKEPAPICRFVVRLI